MPYRICKSIEIENGHMLTPHPDKCRFPRGHSRKVEIVIEADELDTGGMVCDFKIVKDAVGGAWDIGQWIVERQQALGWGESVVELVAADLRGEFPGATGFSARNVWDMRRLYVACTDAAVLAQAARKGPKLGARPIPRQAVAELNGGKRQERVQNPSAKRQPLNFCDSSSQKSHGTRTCSLSVRSPIRQPASITRLPSFLEQSVPETVEKMNVDARNKLIPR